jgi:hypothetical protein
VKTVQKAAEIAVQTGSRLYTDSASSYRGRCTIGANSPDFIVM